jgi:hypothetical protein
VTVYKDNPAGRLHQLLAAFHSADGSLRSFAQALKLPYDKNDALLRGFTQVFALPDDIKTEISQVNEDNYDRDLALRWQDDLADVIGSTLFWGEKNPDSPTFSDFLASLEYCSIVLHKFRPRQMPSENDLKHLKELISDLVSQLQDDPSIDTDLRGFLLSHAEAMKRALDDLSVRGIAPLEEAFDRTVGALNRRPDLTVRSTANPGVWKKFGDLIIAVAAVLQISTSAFVLPGQIHQAIEGPQPTQVEVVQTKPQGPAAPGTNAQPGDASGHFEKKSERDRTSPAS